MSQNPANSYFVPNRFVDQVALVVGGAHGIGKAIAVRLAREGALVVISDIDRKVLAQTAQEISSNGGKVDTIKCDVRVESQVKHMVASVIRKHRRIDVLMQIAGVAKAAPLLKTTTRHYDWTIDTNVKGSFLVARAVLPHMIKRRRGKLVFMASTNSWDAEAELAPYNISKAGVFLLAKTIAREFGQYGINSNALGPGFIRTRLSEWVLEHPLFVAKYKSLIPQGRIGEPEDVAGPAAFLASRDSDYVNGVLLFVDGGQLA
ncbi:MAG TPA: SDR family oxidoreductase [Terriglobia bacterium]|nr:SDR family oxidoreductase [Terriglobia bacterium]